ncbi:MAG: hypothetical protein ACOC22_01375 [bacterium]
MKQKTLSDLYDEYKLRHNGKPKHDFSHFAIVMSSLEHHRTLIRPMINWWYGYKTMNRK